MDEISIRYGEEVTLPFDANDSTATEATLFVGKPGELPKITQPITLTGGNGVFELTETDTSIPLGEYKYQINVMFGSAGPEKYPNPDCDDCDEGSFPTFSVHEALDVTEVVS
jgi:hypothetical protein